MSLDDKVTIGIYFEAWVSEESAKAFLKETLAELDLEETGYKVREMRPAVPDHPERGSELLVKLPKTKRDELIEHSRKYPPSPVFGYNLSYE